MSLEMGILVDGHWTETDSSIINGRYIRPEGQFAARLNADIAAAVHAQPGRFHLIASRSCPWSHRTLIVRTLKRLEPYVPMKIASGPRVEGYAVNGGQPWQIPGTEAPIRHLHQLYSFSEPDYSGRATVPVLWDSERRCITSNESSEIMRVFDTVNEKFDDAFTLIPPRLATDIETLNKYLYDNLFNAVYRAGFAQRQSAYEEAVGQVFGTLDKLEQRLQRQRYLFGTMVTDTDWRLFVTLVRFDIVYYILFKCSRKRLVDFPGLWAYARDLYSWRGIAETCHFDAIRDGYYANDDGINPFGIVAVTPLADWNAPHGRERLGAARLALTRGGDVTVAPGTLEPLSGSES